MKKEIILGTAQFMSSYGVTKSAELNERAKLELLNSAWDFGISTLDTAASYTSAHEVIAKCEKPFKIHTKLLSDEVTPVRVSEINRELKIKQIDVLYLHDALGIQNKESLKILSEHKGLWFKKLGISVYSDAEFNLAVDNVVIDVIQAPFNILNREIKYQSLKAANRAGKKIIARSIFLQGLLAANGGKVKLKFNKLAPYIDNLELISKRFNMSLEELAINWILSLDFVNSVIIGVENKQQLVKNIKLFNEKTNDDLIRILEKIKLPDLDLVDPRKWALEK